MSRVVLAMSGGVDSSVAAHLLLEQGHEVVGVFMRHGHASADACQAEGGGPSPILPIAEAPVGHKQGCCSAADAEDARRVADQLDIPFYALDLQEEFRGIIQYFVDEYTAGRTPNPCVMCNNWIKFGRLFDYADSIDADYVATGHYARVKTSEEGESCVLLRGLDTSKDQSYVLFGVDHRLLGRMLLPVGEFNKTQIRDMAAQLGLRNAEKRDSQEICFVTSGGHDHFVRQWRGNIDTSGELVTTSGRVVGRHPGIERFTVGQRKGLGVALGEPYFVVEIKKESHRVVIGRRHELGRKTLTADRTNWLVRRPSEPFRCQVKIRYNSPANPASAELDDELRLHVELDEPRDGIAPGQAVVCYQDDQVLGGGWIL